MKKKEVQDYLYKIFNSKENGVHQIEIDKMINKAISMISDLYSVKTDNIKDKLALGKKIEREHTKKDGQFQEIIALQHIAEKLEYYVDMKPKNWAEKELNGEEKEDKTDLEEARRRIYGIDSKEQVNEMLSSFRRINKI